MRLIVPSPAAIGGIISLASVSKLLVRLPREFIYDDRSECYSFRHGAFLGALDLLINHALELLLLF